MAKRKVPIAKEVLTCILVFVILMSVVPSSAFAMQDNNSVSDKTIRLANTEVKAASVLEIKFTGTAVERCGVVAGADYWIVNVEELISGPPWSGKLTVYTINIFADSPIWGYADPDITVGDKVEVYGKCVSSWGGNQVTLNGREDYYIKKTDGTKCGKITNWKTACTNVQLGGKFGAEMDFDNLMAGGYRFKGIVRVRSPTDEVYSGENQPRFVPSSPNNHGKFAGGNTLYVTIPEGASAGKYDVKLELWNADTNTLCDETGWKENIFTVKDGGAVSEIVFIGTAIECHEASGMPGEASYWIVSVDKLISGPQPCSNQIKVITGQAIGPLPWGYVDPSIKESDKVKVYGKYDENLYGSDECAVWVYESEDYYIKKSSSCGSIKITRVSPQPGTTLNAGDTVTFTVNVDYDLEECDYGKIRLSVNQYTTGTTDKEYSIGTFEPHSGSYTFTHTETIGDDWENVYVTVKLYAAKQGKPLPTPYTDFDYKQYPVKGKGGGSLLHFDLDYKGTEPASGEGDGNDLHQLYAQVGQSFVMYTFYKEGNAGNQYIIRAYPEWDKKSFILNSDNDESTSELAQEMGGHRYDVENYIIPSVPGEYKIKVVYSNSVNPPTGDNYNRLLGEFTVIVEGDGDCFETVPSDHWKGEYYNNKNLEGRPLMVRDDGTGYLNFDWGEDSPSTACGIGTDFFSVRWTRTLNFDSGTWRFTATTDDGMRVYVDGSLVIDKWFNQVATTYIADVDLTAGTHTIKVEYYEYDLTAVAKLSWEKGDGKEIKFTGTATDYWVSGGQIRQWTVLVDEVISGPQPCEDQVDIMVYDSEFPPPWGYVDPNLNIGDRVEVYGRYYDGDCSAIHLHGSTDYYIKLQEKKPDLTVTDISFSKANPVAGEPITITATIKNIGNADFITTFKVAFYQNSFFDENSFEQNERGARYCIGESEPIGGLNVESTTKVSTTWDAVPIRNDRDEHIEVVIYSGKDKNVINKAYQSVNIQNYKFNPAVDGYHFENYGQSEDVAEFIKGRIRADIETLPYSLISNPLIWIPEKICYSMAELTKHCYGMSSTSILYQQGDIQKPEVVRDKDTFDMLKSDSDVLANINYYHAQQAFTIFDKLKYEFAHSTVDLEDEFNKIKESTGRNIPMMLLMWHEGRSSGHVVVAIDVYVSNDLKIKNAVVYDSDFPGMATVVKFDLKANEITYPPNSDFKQAIAEYPAHQGDVLAKLEKSIRECIDALLEHLTEQNFELLTVSCPVNVTITDEYGRVISDGGVNEIPNARIETIGDVKMFFVPAELTYIVNIEAYDSGNFTFGCVSPIAGNTTAITGFTNISISSNTKASVTIEPEVTDYTMSIDYNGDGTTDEMRSPEVSETVEVEQPPGNPTLIPDKPEPQPAGSTIKWTASATDPDGDTLYYRFQIRGPATGNSWTLKRDWSTDSSWTWYTNSADIGDTDISVWIRDGHHKPPDSYDLEKFYFDYTITGSAQGLVAEWRFDEGSGNIVKDSSGNGNDGTVHGATFVGGVSGYALNFDGIDDYVNVKHNEIFNATEQITIEAWINWNHGASGIDLIVDKGGLVYWFIIDSGDAISMCFLDDIENTIYGTGEYFIPYQGKWVHAVGTYDGTDIRLYLNGELANHYEHKGKITADNRPLRIGANEHSQDNFEGKIDEVRIYNRALSAEEILERYNNSPALSGS